MIASKALLQNTSHQSNARKARFGGAQAVQKSPPAIQMMKSQPKDSLEMLSFYLNAMGFMPGSLLKMDIDRQEKMRLCWESAVSTYQKNLANGKRYCQPLESNLKTLQTDPKNKDWLDSQTEKRKTYTEKFHKNYFTRELEKANESTYRIGSVGLDSHDPASRSKAQALPEEKMNYRNTVDLDKGELTGGHNFAVTLSPLTLEPDYSDGNLFDIARKRGEGLNNSEIFWQQYQWALKQHPHASTASAFPQKLILADITNKETLLTMLMALEGESSFNSFTQEEFQYGTEECYALLGSTIGRASVFMLNDHLDEMGMRIKSITIKGNNCLIVEYVD
ncbi:hypothetical protein [Aureibacter tunicatorum]|uniref:Uncharacterized protein n=1 Tax=Aureibacter tunicatorum TaxID=866807 RepID=A0AAE3XL49_9BACT|nr:hypothetical protein [Aureibacter tunicatorum]MDR6238608.1 hypothetical protein [Aureibacter tunicatorum]